MNPSEEDHWLRTGHLAQNTPEDWGAAAQDKLVSPDMLQVLTDQGQVGLVPRSEELLEYIGRMGRETGPGQTQHIRLRHGCQ